VTHITLSPDSGPPGTVVHIDGDTPGGLTSAQVGSDGRLTHAVICWDGCQEGITNALSELTWSDTEPGHFTMSFTVPRAPWLSGSSPHPLDPGDYGVGVQCLPPSIRGCLALPAQATATFHLTGPPPVTCPSASCAWLRFIPASAPPGTLVKVEGWAPLVQLDGDIGSRYDSYYWLVPSSDSLIIGDEGQPNIYQSPTGDLKGEFRVRRLNPGPSTLSAQAPRSGRILLAPTTFAVTNAPSWASLGQVHPLLVQDGAALDLAITADPTNPRRLAYCVPGAIRLSTDGGASWSAIPTDGVRPLMDRTDYQLLRQSRPRSPQCDSVVLDPLHPRSFYAALSAGLRPYGAPPQFYVGVVSADNGRTWTMAPTPTNSAPVNFGGFQVDGHGISVLFSESVTRPGVVPGYGVERTTDGGRTWSATRLTCPATGPCIRWGPAPSGIGSCAMHSYFQPILYSVDGGRNWSSPTWPLGTNFCNPIQLAALSTSTVALVEGGLDQFGNYPLRISRDGGRTWAVIALPNLPGLATTDLLYPPLLMLPDGSLLAALERSTQPSSSWYLLRPAADSWCRVAGNILPTNLTQVFSVRAIASRLWWLSYDRQPSSIPSAASIPLADVRCDAGP
jgi:hypothetical protein